MNAAIICVVVLLSTAVASDDSFGKKADPRHHSRPDLDEALAPLPQDPPTDPAAPSGQVTPPNGHTSTEAPATIGTNVTTSPEVTTPEAAPNGLWTVPDHQSGVVCILMEMKAELEIQYVQDDNEGEVGVATIDVPPTAEVSGNCGDTDQVIDIFWKDFDAERSIHLEYHLADIVNSTEESYVISKVEIEVEMNMDQFPKALILKNLTMKAVDSTRFLELDTNSSYTCHASRAMNLDYNYSWFTYNATLTFSEMKVQAFRTKNDTSFGKAKVCAADETVENNIVPIAVGCALAALVVIVVIAYLISRKKMRSEYQAM